ncbi:MAG: 3-phosphoshikimate 1-carboxyvinyltransferase [Sedimentisphaeraceae bacterium JB056]
MELKVRKSTLNGRVRIPASKSHTIRAVAIASLAEGKSFIRNPLKSADALSSAAAYSAFGAKLNLDDDKCWIIEGCGGRIGCSCDMIDIGNSGTTLRLAAGSAALASQDVKVLLTGDKQIQRRPIEPLLKSLNDLGAKCRSLYDNGCAPIEITGTLKGGRTEIECVTSQYLSSLLMCCPLAEGDTEIVVTLLNEPDYVKITTDWLDWQSIEYESNGPLNYKIRGAQSYKSFDREIPADFSSATFFLCAAAMLGGKVVIEGLDYSDSQPDKAVADYLKEMGADIEFDGSDTIVKTSSLHGIDIDMNRTPDALPMMAVVGAFAEGTTRLLNVPQARKKETDRIACMAAELKKMGADIHELPDGLVINKSKLKAAVVDGNDDHRIVMSMAVAGMLTEGVTTVTTAEAMNITFPDFTSLMMQIGGNIEMC